MPSKRKSKRVIARDEKITPNPDKTMAKNQNDKATAKSTLEMARENVLLWAHDPVALKEIYLPALEDAVNFDASLSLGNYANTLNKILASVNGTDAEATAKVVRAVNEYAALNEIKETAESVSIAILEGCDSEGRYLMGLNRDLADALSKLAAVRKAGAK